MDMLQLLFAQPEAGHGTAATALTLVIALGLVYILHNESRIYRLRKQLSLPAGVVMPASSAQVLLSTTHLLSASKEALALLPELDRFSFPVALRQLENSSEVLSQLIQRTHACKDFSLHLNRNDSAPPLHLQAQYCDDRYNPYYLVRILRIEDAENNPFYQRLHNNLDALASPALIMDTTQKVVMVNPLFTHLTGYKTDDFAQHSATILRPDIHTPALYEALWEQVNSTGHWTGQLWLRHKSGNSHLEQVTVSAVLNDHGHTTHYLVILTGAEHADSFTYIPSSAYSGHIAELPQHDALEAELKHSRETSELILIDICRYQLLKDSFGREAAEIVLAQYIRRLQEILPHDAFLAQVGSDEFAIMMQRHSTPETVNFLSEILHIGRIPVQHDGMDILLPVNLGVARYPQHGESLEAVLSAAGSALFNARNQGANQFAFYQPQVRQKIADDLRLESRLRAAVEANKLSLHYQPIFDQAQRLCKVEALLRWQDEEHGFISPAVFIPLAEQTDLIQTIGDWVLKEACRQHASWREAGLGCIPVAVNVSSQQLRQGHLLGYVRELLTLYDVLPHYLELEITESTLMDHIDEGKTLLASLKGLGLKLAIDDFGTGYSSLAYLNSFAVDTLKVDRSFIQQIKADQPTIVLDAIIDLARNLNLNLVAEGVETEAQLNYLQSRACPCYQGFLLSRPLSAEGLEYALRTAQLIRRNTPGP